MVRYTRILTPRKERRLKAVREVLPHSEYHGEAIYALSTTVPISGITDEHPSALSETDRVTIIDRFTASSQLVGSGGPRVLSRGRSRRAREILGQKNRFPGRS